MYDICRIPGLYPLDAINAAPTPRSCVNQEMFPDIANMCGEGAEKEIMFPPVEKYSLKPARFFSMLSFKRKLLFISFSVGRWVEVFGFCLQSTVRQSCTGQKRATSVLKTSGGK